MSTPDKNTGPRADANLRAASETDLPATRTPRPPAIELSARDLNAQGGIFCPSPKADMKVWNTHPKVYLDIARTGEAKCPYCGTVYRLKAGEKAAHGH